MSNSFDTPIVFMNDTFVPQSNASLSIMDAGFVQGATVVERLRTFQHRMYSWPDHFDRFRNSCRCTNIFPALPEDEIAANVEKLVKHNVRFLEPKQELMLVMFVTPGLVDGTESPRTPTFVMHTYPLPFAKYRLHFERGVRLVVPRVRQVPPECFDPRIKHRSRLHWWLAQHEVEAVDETAQALLLDVHGFVTETATANFLAVHDGVVASPPRHAILEGVSLRVVREICDELRIPFRERPLTLYDCQTADEAFVTSTPFCIAGVRRINGQPLQWPGRVFERILDKWSEIVEIDIAAQILQ